MANRPLVSSVPLYCSSRPPTRLGAAICKLPLPSSAEAKLAVVQVPLPRGDVFSVIRLENPRPGIDFAGLGRHAYVTELVASASDSVRIEPLNGMPELSCKDRQVAQSADSSIDLMSGQMQPQVLFPS